MVTILFTKGTDLIIKSCFISETNEYAVILEDKDGEMQVLETFKSIMFLVEAHDFWCKYIGIIESSQNTKTA